MDRKGLLGALGAIVMGLVVSWSDAQTSAFSYQGVLTDQSMSADGVYDLRFSLYSSETGGSALGVDEHLGVEVSEGVFGVSLDFGSSAFVSGNDRYLGIEVREAGVGSYVALDPRVLLGRVPFAAHADRADVATFAFDGPFAPEDPRPGSSSGAPGQTVIVNANFGSTMTSGWDIRTPIRIEREVIRVNGEVSFGGVDEIVVELARVWDGTTLYTDLFDQVVGAVEISVEITRAGDQTDFGFIDGVYQGHRFEQEPGTNELLEVVTVVYQQPMGGTMLNTQVQRSSSGFFAAALPGDGVPSAGGDAAREGLYFYEFDRHIDPFSNAGALPRESRPVNFGIPLATIEAEPVSLLLNVFSDPGNALWSNLTSTNADRKALYLVDDQDVRIWESESGPLNRAIVGSWTLDRADDGGLFETYEIYYNPDPGF